MKEEQVNTIGKEFTMLELIKFVSAPVVSKLFISLLSTLDDSLFISRYCGPNALAAFTMGMPWFMAVDFFVMVIGEVAAKCSMLMGEKKNDEAKSSFTTMIIVAFLIGLFLTTILSLFRVQIFTFLGATEELLPYVTAYVNVSRWYMPLYLMVTIFNRFYVIAGKPKVAAYTMFVQIFCNLFFDWLLIVKLDIGIVGAAYGNLAGNALLCLIGFIFFSNKNHEIHFAKPLSHPLPLIKTVWKLGRSQGLGSLAVSLNIFVINQVLMSYGGERLVAGYTVVNNVQMMFMNAFWGFNATVSPLVSYAYGERNPEKLTRIIKKALILIECLSVIVAIFIFLFKKPLLFLYFSENADATVKEMAAYGLSVIPFVFWVFSFNCMARDFFVAVGNYRVSMFLSVMENIVLGNLVYILLPKLFGINAIWYGLLVQQLFTLIFTLMCVYINKDVYGYGKDGIASFTEI